MPLEVMELIRGVVSVKIPCPGNRLAHRRAMIDARHQESVNSHLLDRHIFHMFMSHE